MDVLLIGRFSNYEIEQFIQTKLHEDLNDKELVVCSTNVLVKNHQLISVRITVTTFQNTPAELQQFTTVIVCYDPSNTSIENSSY